MFKVYQKFIQKHKSQQETRSPEDEGIEDNLSDDVETDVIENLT